jgi:hypothetical protein
VGLCSLALQNNKSLVTVKDLSFLKRLFNLFEIQSKSWAGSDSKTEKVGD